MRGVHAALRRSLRSFALPMVMCLERWLYATWPDLLMAYFLRLTHKVRMAFVLGDDGKVALIEYYIVLIFDSLISLS